jgi:2',3'-cyclic-nucleotide 2'-phosphodiesterase (5'-nucleotidase family)
MMKKLIYILPLLLLLTAMGCKPRNYIIQQINPAGKRINTLDSLNRPDSSILALIAPYKLKLDSQMKVIIGSTLVDMPNTRPNGTLGNFIADILKTQTQRIIKTDIDFAFTNISGIRQPMLPAGDITKGKVFEILPFDNMVVAAEVKGETLKKVFEQIAAKGGEAITGFKLTIKDNKLVEATYNNNIPVDYTKNYVVCTTDFLFTGGDNYTMFKEGVVKEYKTGITIRDMVMDYIYNMCAVNGALNPQPDERITVQ